MTTVWARCRLQISMRLAELDYVRNNNIVPKTPSNEPIYVIAISQETAHGDTEETWQAMCEGRPLVVKELDSNSDPLRRNEKTRYHMPLSGDPFSSLHPGDRKERKYFSRSAAFSVVHARSLLEKAGLLDDNGQYLDNRKISPHLVSVIIGSGFGSSNAAIDVYETLKVKGPNRILPSDASKQFPEQPNAKVASMLGLRGANILSTNAACASGTQAIVLALEALRLGNSLAIAGGIEVVGDEKEDLEIASFTSFPALSQQNESPTNSSRPFDAKRDGFVAASAIGLVLLARASLVKELKLEPLAEIVAGTYFNSGSIDITRDDPYIQAREIARMLTNLKTGRSIIPDLIWSHGTSTGLGDRTAAIVYDKLFGRLVRMQSDGENDPIIIYAPKGVLGHSMGASGGSAVVTAVQSIRDRVVPPMKTLEKPSVYADNELAKSGFKRDESIPDDFIGDFNFSREGVQLNFQPTILVENQGFGSHNADVVLKVT